MLQGRPEAALSKLPDEKRDAVERALRAIRDHPYSVPERPKAISHMKGEWLCHREFRGLPQAMRIIYWVDKSEREVRVKYIGPHL